MLASVLLVARVSGARILVLAVHVFAVAGAGVLHTVVVCRACVVVRARCRVWWENARAGLRVARVVRARVEVVAQHHDRAAFALATGAHVAGRALVAVVARRLDASHRVFVRQRNVQARALFAQVRGARVVVVARKRRRALWRRCVRVHGIHIRGSSGFVASRAVAPIANVQCRV